MRNTLLRGIGNLLIGLSGLAYLAWAVASCVLDAGALYLIHGVWAILIGVVLLPITCVVLPVYVGIAWHAWRIAWIQYGGAAAASAFYYAGRALVDASEPWYPS